MLQQVRIWKEFYDLNRSVVDPDPYWIRMDPYSGASWIRICIPYTDPVPDPHMQI